MIRDLKSLRQWQGGSTRGQAKIQQRLSREISKTGSFANSVELALSHLQEANSALKERKVEDGSQVDATQNHIFASDMLERLREWVAILGKSIEGLRPQLNES